MVDFKKRLVTKVAERPTDPLAIYKRLDRASDKGPLRPAQEAVLEMWHTERRAQRDVILKLHTGEGKTLIGLLILQAKLNELGEGGRALYMCPNLFLVNQTLTQARQFGVACVPVDADGSLPAAFLDGRAILVASVQKLFNGLTKFGLGAVSERVDSLVMDDAHACIDAIKDACVITLERQHPAYQEIFTLFGKDLEDQGVGTYAELRAHDATVLLPVPYWAWIDRHRDVAAILAKHTATKAVKFTWPIIRDRLRDCLCIVSGKELVIAPYRLPLELFGSYANASHRTFMSATISDDSFLVRGLGLEPQVIADPLTFTGNAWSGEKMVLIPSNIDDSLIDAEIVHSFAKPKPKSSYGTVALVPSFDESRDWESEGAIVAKPDDIDARIERLSVGDREKTLVIVNRYDGIDLPDDTCRILILDGKPFGESLLDRYMESCRPGSDVITMRNARVIEQGMGRAVRGEKDYCVIILSGSSLIRIVRTREGRVHFSPQTRKQIEIGLAIAEYAREEINAGAGAKTPLDALLGLVRQSLARDEGWKDYYVERMNELTVAPTPARLADVFAIEHKAELFYETGEVDKAVSVLQELLDKRQITNASDFGWYLQETARYRYSSEKSEALHLQAAAHKRNRYLLKPTEGVRVSRLEPISQRRAERILAWLQQHVDDRSVMAVVNEVVSALRFGTRAETFERAFQDLGCALGFACERPDKEWKAGPDNLWALRDGEYLLAECKSEVETTRAEINKNETGQMNNASAWFEREYPGARVTRVLIIPARKLGAAAGFSDETVLLRERGLRALTQNVRAFFVEICKFDLRDISERKVQILLDQHQLGIADLQTRYYDVPKQP